MKMPCLSQLYGAWRKPDNEENIHQTRIQVEQSDLSSENAKADAKQTNSQQGSFLGDIIFCILITVMWTTVFISFGNFGAARSEGSTVKDYLYLGCFIALTIVALFDVYYQNMLVKKARQATPKLYIVGNHKAPRHHVLRIRISNSEEKAFIETELAENQLDYDSMLETCCKELGIEKCAVMKIRKLPDSAWCTLVRKNADVKRFRKIEYLEFVIA